MIKSPRDSLREKFDKIAKILVQVCLVMRRRSIGVGTRSLFLHRSLPFPRGRGHIGFRVRFAIWCGDRCCVPRFFGAHGCKVASGVEVDRTFSDAVPSRLDKIVDIPGISKEKIEGRDPQAIVRLLNGRVGGSLVLFENIVRRVLMRVWAQGSRKDEIATVTTRSDESLKLWREGVGRVGMRAKESSEELSLDTMDETERVQGVESKEKRHDHRARQEKCQFGGNARLPENRR